MSFNLTTVTGAPITGWTTPGYTMTAMQGVDTNWKQFYVSALTGTQAGVRAHVSPADPFTTAMSVPKSFAARPVVDSTGRWITPVQMNRYNLNVRKGMTVIAGQPPVVGMARCQLDVPSGAEANDVANLKALVALLAGVLYGYPNAIADTLTFGAN